MVSILCAGKVAYRKTWNHLPLPGLIFARKSHSLRGLVVVRHYWVSGYLIGLRSDDLTASRSAGCDTRAHFPRYSREASKMQSSRERPRHNTADDSVSNSVTPPDVEYAIQ
jgi:hypothetical protein